MVSGGRERCRKKFASSNELVTSSHTRMDGMITIRRKTLDECYVLATTMRREKKRLETAITEL